MTTQNIETPKMVFEISRRGKKAVQIVASDPIDSDATSVIDARCSFSGAGMFKSFGIGPVFTKEVVNPTVLATV